MAFGARVLPRVGAYQPARRQAKLRCTATAATGGSSSNSSGKSSSPSVAAGAAAAKASMVSTSTEGLEVYTATAAAGPSSSAQQLHTAKLKGMDVEAHAMRLAVEKHLRGTTAAAGGSGDREQAGGAPEAMSRFTGAQMDAAYERCGYLTSEYAKTFYLGTQLMTPEKARAIWAIYVWCRRTDELVDGPNAARVTPAVLDRWEERLEEVSSPIDNHLF